MEVLRRVCRLIKDEKIEMGKVAISGAGGATTGMVMGSSEGRGLSIAWNTGISMTQAVVTDCYTEYARMPIVDYVNTNILENEKDEIDEGKECPSTD